MLKKNEDEYKIMNFPEYDDCTGTTIKYMTFETINDKISHAEIVEDMFLQALPDATRWEPNIDYPYNPKTKSKYIMEIMRQASSDGVQVMFSSLGLRYTEDDYKTWREAFKYARDHNIFVIWCSGNEGKDIDTKNLIATIPELITLGAVHIRGDKAKIANYSNIGDVVDFVSASKLWSDLRWGYNEGTSYRLAEAAFGKIIDYCNLNNIKWDYDYIYNLMLGHAIDLGDEGKDEQYGNGLIVLPPKEKVKGVDYVDITKPCRDLNELEPSTRYLAKLFLQKCKEKNIDVLITETYRSQERQEYLYAQGRTRSGNKVTWTLNSKHKSRKAFDFVPLKNGKADWNDISKFKKIGEIGKSIGLTWGGDWKQKDYPHFQYDGSDINMEDNKNEVSEWAKEAQKWVIQESISDGTRPKELVTREELWTMLYRIKK